MSVYQEIKASRRLVWTGAVVGFAFAVGVAAANITSDDGGALAALAFLAVFALPPALALLSLDRRPSLLTVAAMAALVQAVLTFTSLGLLELVPAILWYMAGRRRPRAPIAPRGSAWLRPVLAVATVVPLLAMVTHLDPTCIVTDSGGSVIRTYEYEDAPSGWSLRLGSSATSSSTDGETTTCTTNDLVAWESGLSVALSATYIVLVAVWWPTAERLARDDVLSDRRA